MKPQIYLHFSSDADQAPFELKEAVSDIIVGELDDFLITQVLWVLVIFFCTVLSLPLQG